jgi:putative autoinducer-2 (AI-2) aldolase
MQKGARGIDFGRRVWRHTHPVPIIRALRMVVHERATPQQAYDAFRDMRGR